MRRELGRVLRPQPTEVHDASHTSGARRRSERERRLGVSALEVVRVERVHQVVGDVGAAQRMIERVGVADVGAHGPPRPVIPIGVPGHRPHVVALGHQRPRESAADEARGAGHEDVHGLSLPRSGPRTSRAARIARRRRRSDQSAGAVTTSGMLAL